MNCKHLLNCEECAMEASASKIDEERIDTGWFWAYAEYTDEGWTGPYPTRELALAYAKDTDEDAVDGDEPTEFSFIHIDNVGTLEKERDKLRTVGNEMHRTLETLQAETTDSVAAAEMDVWRRALDGEGEK